MNVNTINQYINSLNENAIEDVSGFVNFMEKEFPKINPKISYAMPMWWVGPKMYNGYVGVSAAKKHYSIHFHNENYISDLKKELPSCSFGKRCINIEYGDQDAISVVKQYVIQYFNGLLGN